MQMVVLIRIALRVHLQVACIEQTRQEVRHAILVSQVTPVGRDESSC